MTLKIQTITILLLVALTTISSCQKEESITTYDCTNTTPTYVADVKAIIDNNCSTTGCHDANTAADGKDFSSYDLVKEGTQSYSFLGSIQHVVNYKSMPKGASKLSAADIKTISCWVQNGTPEQ